MTHNPAKYRRKISFILYLRILFISWPTHAKKMLNLVYLRKKRLLKHCLCLNNLFAMPFEMSKLLLDVRCDQLLFEPELVN